MYFLRNVLYLLKRQEANNASEFQFLRAMEGGAEGTVEVKNYDTGKWLI